MSQQNFKKIWAGLIIILLILFTIGWVISDRRFQYELENASNQSKKELAFISGIIQKNLQKYNYQSNQNFILSWGERTPDIVEIILTTKNGFKLAHYNNSQIPAYELVENSDITYSYDGMARLKLRKNLDELYNNHIIFLYELIAGYFFIAIVFYYLTYTIVRTQKQKQALTFENKQRILAENELSSTLKTLQEREQNLAITLNSIGDAVITTDVEGHVNRMNPVAEQLTGWSLHEAKGQEVRTVFSIINASTREPIENPVEKVISTGNIIYLSNHTTLISKDGTEYHIADSAAPIRDGDDNIQGMILVFNDVTEQYKLREGRLESEERFRQLAENIQEVFWLGSPSWDEIFYISPAYEKIWGQNPENLYQNPSLWIESVHPDDREQVINDIPKDIGRIGEYIEFRKYRIQRSDGQILWIKARAYPIKDHDGRVIRIAGIAENITEQVNMEETLRRTQKMDALGKLTGGISHDFNNLLGVILGYTELLEDKLADTPPLNRYINEISLAGNRAKILTSKLLAFSSKQSTDKKSSNINCLLERDQHMLEKTLTAKINLTIEKANELWDVCIDEELLADSILNMCINSMHAMPKGGKLTISTKNTQLNDSDVRSFSIPAGNYVQLSVTDTGAGMSSDIKGNLFEPFFTTKGDAGTGLGMSQVYGFVKQSNGEIQVLSEPGEGTQIDIYIPRYIKQINDNCCITKSHETPTPSKNEIILVVDDEPALRELAEEILKSHNYQVLCAESGEEALQILTTKDIDLMLTDVIMPNMDGYQLASQVKQQFPKIKILIASGYNEQMLNENSNSALYDQLDKPYSSENLLNKIRKLLDE